MDQAIKLTRSGGTDGLTLVPHEPQTPSCDEIRIRHEAIGFNFIDIYHRIGLYPLPLPAILGVEGAGFVEAAGDGIVDLKVGNRVAYAGVPVGAYASTRLLPRNRAIRLLSDIPSKVAAGSMLRGLTAHMLLTQIYPVGPRDTILIHAAAGGLGGLLVRWAEHLGAVVIGTAGSPEKAARAKAHGVDHMIVGREADIASEVAALTDGVGVDFAIDGIGRDMLMQTIACVRPFGTVASIGQAGGPIPPIAVDELGPKRSL